MPRLRTTLKGNGGLLCQINPIARFFLKHHAMDLPLPQILDGLHIDSSFASRAAYTKR